MKSLLDLTGIFSPRNIILGVFKAQRVVNNTDDFNSLLTSGIYKFLNGSYPQNPPAWIGNGLILVFNYDDTHVLQVVFNWNEGLKWAWRVKHNTWTGWDLYN